MARKQIVVANVTGDKALDAALKQFPAAFVRKAVKGRLNEAMNLIVLPDAKRNTPVSGVKKGGGKRKSKGQLKRSLKVVFAKNRNGGRLARNKVGWAVTAKKTKTIDAYYAKWVYMDARNRSGKGKLKRAGKLSSRERKAGVASGKTRKGTRTLRNALYKNSRAVNRFLVTMLRKDLPQIARDVAAAGIVKADAKSRKLAAEIQ